MAIRDRVTAEEYDQMLRDTVNAYYVHAMNDPNMSKEEAISTTAQMAERYLTASEEFRASLENETLSNETENGLIAETNNAEGTNNGSSIDGGNEGGMSPGGGIE